MPPKTKPTSHTHLLPPTFPCFPGRGGILPPRSGAHAVQIAEIESPLTSPLHATSYMPQASSVVLRTTNLPTVVAKLTPHTPLPTPCFCHRLLATYRCLSPVAKYVSTAPLHSKRALRIHTNACILLKLRDPGVGPGTGQPSASWRPARKGQGGGYNRSPVWAPGGSCQNGGGCQER